MATPPLPPRKRPGDAIRAQEFNQLVDAVRWATPVAGEGVRVTTTSAGSRVDILEKSARAGVAMAPFTVAFDDGLKDYIVYLPPNTATLDGVTVFLPHAHEPDDAGRYDDWYRIVNSKGEALGRHVFVGHLKRRVETEDGDGNRSVHPVVTVSCHTDGSDGDENYDKACGGDDWRADVAVASRTEETDAKGVTTTVETLQQGFSGVVALPADIPTVLRLYWAAPKTPEQLLVPFGPVLLGESPAPVCGGRLETTPLSNASLVRAYYEIDCSGERPAPSVRFEEIDEDGSGGSGGTVVADAVASVRIYTLRFGNIVSDSRSLVSALVFYP